MNLYGRVNRLNALLVERVGVNPKGHYTTLKAIWQRSLRQLTGKEYGADVNSVNIAVHDVKLVVCGIPKVGTRTFVKEVAFDRVLGDSVLIESSYLGTFLRRHPETAAYYKFGVVRNPWARVVSVYNSKICHPRPEVVRTFFIRYRGLTYGMPFAAFVEWLCESDEGMDAIADRHWLSQHRFLYSGEDLLVDRVAQLESLGDAFDDVCRHIGIATVTLGNYSRKTTAGGRSYRQYYDDRTATLVAVRYAVDIDRFKYGF